MAKQVAFHPLFDCDIREAASWYDRRSRSLGDALVREAKSKVADIQRNPQHYGRYFAEARYAQLSRFPYVVLFEVTGDTIYFAGVLHTARDPSKWRERLN
ncbi:type II toxin-antitoxin system RelE/ParE family toxin [Botrimarina mediterranea]|uniref:type II toxin-antitoxin system RelE/ParE family toxin n=1 Tax=Botrimarina mediterranea TaxID=2528022 RepID=UPI00119FD6A0